MKREPAIRIQSASWFDGIEFNDPVVKTVDAASALKRLKIRIRAYNEACSVGLRALKGFHQWAHNLTLDMDERFQCLDYEK
ncbi:hypothetical protein PGTUg99_012606 [Puccinia graminis f. sp. tritici]|uniref:Uncharacterized protein n=1 Tax=Puccinia graminis f. sp. tritici TaxID=56615 RepID=A0A5B0SJM5_PUCGR|nr:hypothetical protein PGTUg99_012606 [Puccinia graminis f. sp. tritici]